MTAETAAPSLALDIRPLTPDRWPDLEQLFGRQGAYSGCWCMWWRLPGKEFGLCSGQERKEQFRGIVAAGRIPGLLAYREGVPVGWCAISPRDELPRFARSRYWKPIDDLPVWSIACFYIAARQRGQGVATRLLHAAVDYAREQGALVLEAYPKDVAGPIAASSVYTGTAGMFAAAGFEEVARRHPERPIMRLRLG
jgi:GNAT superfamily N-acetyltransferase